MKNNPSFYGQRTKGICPQDGTQRTWIAKFRDGELFFWCSHGKFRREREIVDRNKKKVYK